MKRAFITDEATQDFEEAVGLALELGYEGLELRTVNDTPIDLVPPALLRAFRARLDGEGLCVCALASSFFKCERTAAAISRELEKLERLCLAADILGCDMIRGFSFFAPECGALPPEALAPCYAEAVRLLEARGKLLILEADPSVNTTSHRALAALADAIGSPRVRLLYDPGNCLYDPGRETPYPDGYEAVRPRLAHVHVKDAVREGAESRCVKVSTGGVDWPALLKRLKADGYDGWLSLETHYRAGAQLSEEQMKRPGGAGFTSGGMAATLESALALNALLKGVEER